MSSIQVSNQTVKLLIIEKCRQATNCGKNIGKGIRAKLSKFIKVLFFKIIISLSVNLHDVTKGSNNFHYFKV